MMSESNKEREAHFDAAWKAALAIPAGAAVFHPISFGCPSLGCSCTLVDRATAIEGRRCDILSSPWWVEALIMSKQTGHSEVISSIVILALIRLTL